MFAAALRSLAVIPLTVVLLSTPAAAADFASITADNTPNLQWTSNPDTVGGSLNTIGTGDVFVNLDLRQIALVGGGAADQYFNLPATMTVSATTSTPGWMSAGGVNQRQISGTVSVIYSGLEPLTIGGQSFLAGANLFSATFIDGWLAVGNGSGSGQFEGSSQYPGRTLVYTSDIMDFSGLSANRFNWVFAGDHVNPAVGSSPNDFQTSLGVRYPLYFSSAVPEPATWAMMILGFGVVGTALRARPRQQAV